MKKHVKNNVNWVGYIDWAIFISNFMDLIFLSLLLDESG